MKKRVFSIIISLVIAFLLGMFTMYFLERNQSTFAVLFAKLFQRDTIPFQVAKRFDGTLYYATDRAPSDSDKDFSNRYAGNLSYGTIQTLIPQDFRIGGNLSWENVIKTTALNDQDFFDLLKQKSDKTFIIWVHGYKSSFKSNVTSLLQIANDLNVDAVFIDFDWTSIASALNYDQDAEQVKTSAKLFTQFITRIAKEVKPQKLILIGHSLGSRLISMSFDDLYKNPEFADNPTEFSHVIFLAPNVDRNEFDQNFKKQLTSMVNKLTVYVSSDDNALLLSRFFHNINSLGLPPQTLEDSNLDEIESLLYQQKLAPNKIDIIDVSYFPKRTFGQHSYFKERPILEDIHWLINNDYSPQDRYLLKQNINPQSKNSYWFIPP